MIFIEYNTERQSFLQYIEQMTNTKQFQKIPFLKGILQYSQLPRLVGEWITNIDIDMFIRAKNFKYYPHFIAQVSINFCKEVMIYSLTRRFQNIFTEIDQQALLGLSEHIKDEYCKINSKNTLKNDAYFYFFCVYLTKLCSSFLTDHFSDLQVDVNLQAGIYIILIYTIIGLEVVLKSYQINMKKIIYTSSNKSLKKIHISKIDSLESVVSKSSTNRFKYYQANAEKKLKGASQRKGTVSVEPEQVELQKFKHHLKKNLDVQVLRKIIKKKIKVEEYDSICNQQEKESGGSEKNLAKILKPGRTFLNSNQTSTSLQQAYMKNGENACFIHRNVKISHPPVTFIGKKRWFQQVLKNRLVSRSLSFKNEDDKQQNLKKNWEDVIKNLKQNTIQTKKSFHTHTYTHSHVIKQRLRQLYPLNKKKDIQPELRRSNTIVNDEISKTKDLSFVREKGMGLASYWIESSNDHPQPELISQNSTKILKSHHLRRERHKFDLSCEDRSKYSHYSMFHIKNSNFNVFVK